MGTIKDKNGTDLREAEDTKKRQQENTEELYKKDLHNPDDHNGVITHLEPDILECEVKWTGKDQFSFHSQRKVMPKNAQTTALLHSSHMLAQNSPSQASTTREP